MVPVCSATICSSSYTKVLGLKPLSPYPKSFSNGLHLHKPPPVRLVSCPYSNQSWDSIAENNAILPFEGLPVDPPIVPDLLSIDDIELAEINKVTSDIITGDVDALSNIFSNITSSMTKTQTNASEAVDNAISGIVSFLNNSRDSAGDKLTGVSIGLKEASGKTGIVALDVVKRTILFVENSLVEGVKYAGYAYSSAKELLPQDFREVVNLSEESVAKVLYPAGTAFQQVYTAVGRFEESLGLDPNDPLVPFVLLLGLSATLWGSYRILVYSGYSGDLSPHATFELLRGNDNVVLVDIRSENLRERDGIPDLRRTARFRYTSVTLPEIDGSLRKLLKGGRDIEDTLIAGVVRNLKIVGNGSKVLVMDADGTRSKGVARSLRKLGTKRPYLVQGGFRSWANEGLRIKMVKPETALTILNEDAEAILEEINLTPLKIFGYTAGFAAAAYSLVEWEKALQFIGVIGLGQTLYRRITSYQDADDFKQDMRQLLAPARLSGQAISWAAGKIDTNLNGLPTSPSSSDVQSRVLQAAAKHESQPSDSRTQDSPENDTVQTSEA